MNKLFFIFLSIFLSCGLTKEIEKSDKEIIISLQRTACFGTCPIYKIEILSDYSGIYTGTKFVKNIGVLKFQLATEDVNKILDYATEINFSTFKDEYSKPISDLPTTYIKIKNKKIKDYAGAPKELKNLEILIDDLFQKANKEQTKY